MVPSAGFHSPAIARKSEVLPQPDLPVMTRLFGASWPFVARTTIDGYGLSPYPRGPRRSDYSLWRQSSCTVLPALRSPCVCFPPRSVDPVAGLRGPRLLDLRIGGARRHVCNSRARPELRIAVLARRLRTQFLPPDLCLFPWPEKSPPPFFARGPVTNRLRSHRRR